LYCQVNIVGLLTFLLVVKEKLTQRKKRYSVRRLHEKVVRKKILVTASKQISILLFAITSNGGLGIQESSQEGLVVRKNVE